MAKKIFVTGMAGVGKSTVADELRDRGVSVIDVDHVLGLCSWVNVETRERVGKNTDNVSDEFIDQHEYECDMQMLQDMMNKTDEAVFVFGCVGDNSDFLPLFDKTILLQCAPEIRVERLKSRDTSEMGKDPAVQERTIKWGKIFESLMIEAGAVVIDTEQSLDKVVGDVLLNTK